MASIFIIPGYGIPKDILQDANYQTYLKLVFNSIYDQVLKNNIKKPVIIFSGGKTDIYKPYKRDEAREMMKYFKTICKRKDLIKKTKNWQIFNESQSLSTLENIIFTKKKLSQLNIKKGQINIFCEATRFKKVKIFAKRLLLSFETKVLPIDFDVSSSRYLDPKMIEEKELQDIQFGLWALESKENYKKYHQLFVQRMAYFRKKGPKKHIESVHKWWQDQLGEIKQ